MSKFLRGWSAAGFNYFVKSILGFFHLLILYIFVPIPTLQIPIRNLLIQLLTLINAESFECLILREFVGLYKSPDFLNIVPENIKSSYSGIKWIGYFDYKKNFAANF